MIRPGHFSARIDMSEEETKLVAAKGFSANGVSMFAGQPHKGQFDAQTVKVLRSLGRLVPDDQYTDDPVPAADEDDGGAQAATGGKKQNRAVLPGTGDGASAPAGGGLPGVNG
jgi:hypothetical protein